MNTEREIIAKYNELHELIDKMGKAVLELMRHPDVSNEELDEARLKYFTAYGMWIAARMALRKAIPGNSTNPFQRELPWNTKES